MALDKPPPPKRRPSGKEEKAEPSVQRPVATITAAESLKIEPRSIEVADGETLDLSPGHPRYGGSFARVRIMDHGDLQLIGLAPRGLSQEKIRAAIAADDAEAYRLATAMVERGHMPPGCDCDGAEALTDRRANPVRMAMTGFRARHNPSLARTLSDHYGTQIGMDTPLAAMIRKMSDRLTLREIEVPVLHLADIVIGRNATLSVASGTMSMAARHIYIEQTGTLRLNGGYTKIWASSIGRFRLRLESTVVSLGAKMKPIWLDG